MAATISPPAHQLMHVLEPPPKFEYFWGDEPEGVLLLPMQLMVCRACFHVEGHIVHVLPDESGDPLLAKVTLRRIVLNQGRTDCFGFTGDENEEEEDDADSRA